MSQKIDPISQRIDTLCDIVFALHAGGHMRRQFTAEEVKQLRVVRENLGAMLKREYQPLLCRDCGANPADHPSKLCPGCEAYREHTGAA